MGLELEYKLAVRTPALLEQILVDPRIAQVRQGGYRMLTMATVYYDTPDRKLSNLRWTLRLRQENENLIATLKTPTEGRARGEWECPASDIHAAIPMLLEQGAPEQLTQLLADQPLIPVCSARFIRRAADVVLADGTVCELCGDMGTLAGGTREENFCEIEIELKSGSAETAAAFSEALQERFDLQEETRSKFARASALAKEARPMKVLLHICCAPCANRPLANLQAQGHEVTGYWYNPNIHPFTEYRARRNTVREYLEEIGVPLLEQNDYALRPFVRAVAEDIAHRCVKCYEMRLFETARTAKERGFDAFTSSLFISPYQNHSLMKEVAERAAAEYGVAFLYQDFRPLFKEGQDFAREHGFYMQKYCGCVFSEEERYLKAKKIIP